MISSFIKVVKRLAKAIPFEAHWSGGIGPRVVKRLAVAAPDTDLVSSSHGRQHTFGDTCQNVEVKCTIQVVSVLNSRSEGRHCPRCLSTQKNKLVIANFYKLPVNTQASSALLEKCSFLHGNFSTVMITLLLTFIRYYPASTVALIFPRKIGKEEDFSRRDRSDSACRVIKE